jgi:protein phosphatase PTC7
LCTQPWQAQTLRLPVQPGDLIVCATDGLFDNLFVSDICAVLDQVTPDNLSEAVVCSPLSSSSSFNAPGAAGATEVSVHDWARTASETLASEAGLAAASLTRRSPFTTSARKAGFAFEGGKLDDITVIVSLVSSSDSLETSA